MQFKFNLITKISGPTFRGYYTTVEITDRLVIVSISDIANLISKAGLRISDYCSVNKKGKVKFTRKIWVCEKDG